MEKDNFGFHIIDNYPDHTPESDKDSFITISVKENESPLAKQDSPSLKTESDSFMIMESLKEDKPELESECLEDSLTQLSIKTKNKPKKNENKINLSSYNYLQYQQQTIKNKKVRVGFIKKNKKYFNELSSYQEEEYYNQREDKIAMTNYYKDLITLKKITYDDVNELLRTTKKVYKNHKDIYSVIDRRPDWTLKCIYTDDLLENEEGIPIAKNYNKEHCFVQCYHKGANSGSAKDLHNIFIAEQSANLSRGKKILGYIEESDFMKVGKCGKVYKRGKDKSFEPFYNKGVAARAILYILTCYKGICDKKKFPTDYLNYIVNTAMIEPVSLWEKHRNAEIFKRQGNRNPYIDQPKLAAQIDFINNSFN